MENLLFKVAIAMGILALIVGCIGCSRQGVTNQSSSVKDEVKFSTYSQQERQEYIQEYFKRKYGLECQISEVKQRQINIVKNEDYYFATAITEGQEIVSVWVSKNGEISESVFLLDMQNDITEFFQSKINYLLSDYIVKSYTELRDIPTKQWNASDDIEDFLQTENVHSYLRVFLNDTENISEKIFQDLTEAINGYDISLYMYSCPNINEIDFDTFDLSLFMFSKDIEKGK